MPQTATGSRHSLALIAEVTYGVTPATPAFVNVRHTTCSLGLSKSSFEGEELRSDRQIQSFRHGNRTVAGAVGFLLSDTSHDTLIEACLGGTWSANVLKAGVIRRSFTMERHFTNLDIPEYHRYLGCEVSKMSLNVKPDAMVSGSFDIVSQSMSTPATAIITGATYGAATTTQPMDSFSGTINEGGSPIAIITGIDFTLENGMNPLFVIGSANTLQPGVGKSRVSGTVTAFFQSAALLNKFINETASSFNFTVTDGAGGNSFLFSFPNVRYNGGQPDVQGEGEVSLSLPFIALYNTADLSQIVITRV